MTKIEWCEESWNPIVGCSLVSPGCTNCYAMKQAARNMRMHFGQHARAGDGAPFEPSIYADLTQDSKAGPVWTGKVAMVDNHALTKPLRWKRPREIFVNSMGDLFHESVPDAWIDRVFAVLALAHWHTFIVLTKRAKRVRLYCSDPETPERVASAILDFAAAGVITGAAALAPLGNRTHERDACFVPWPLPNVYLGVSAERQQEADERIPDLLATPAAGRFISAEPLLGPITARWAKWVDGQSTFDRQGSLNHLEGLRRLDGVIVGGESGPGARPMHPDWARAIRNQCADAGVPFFFKQHGEFREFDTGSPEIERVDAESDKADAIYKTAINPSFVTDDGRHFARIGLPPDTPARLIERVGKARAGRLLDGRGHNDLPWRPA